MLLKLVQQRLSSQVAAVIVFNGNDSGDKDEHKNDKNYKGSHKTSSLELKN